ncbi:MAG: MBL fold metallo-hydrolase [Hyphomicrobium sp.]
MKLTIVGCSDAFGSGGRLQTSYHVAHAGGEFLIDCGATTLLGLDRLGLDPNRIPAIFITHLHGDHFAGLVWWLIHANYVSRRTATLTIAGPKGIEARFVTAAEALFPGSSTTARKFELTFVEYAGECRQRIAGIAVSPFVVSHPSGATPYALRFDVDGKSIAFSGDTEWVECLVDAARGTDLFIAECFGFDAEARYHMNWRTLERNLERIATRRLLLTHMGPDMLRHRGVVTHPRVVLAEDGLVLDV